MIEEMGNHPERYAKNPGKDFTRRRSLTLPALMKLILTMDEKSVWKGLLGYFGNEIDTPSAGAFVQQRKKLLPPIVWRKGYAAHREGIGPDPGL